MRIIGGQYRGRSIQPPKGLQLRPTTDFAKEALFNILHNKIEIGNAEVLDLFCGTGNISLEFASRGARVRSVDKNPACARFVAETARSLNMPVLTVKQDVFKYLENETATYNIIFADPPYDLPDIPNIHNLVISHQLLKQDGWLVIEHGPKTDLSQLGHFIEQRKYGNVHFSFFHLI